LEDLQKTVVLAQRKYRRLKVDAAKTAHADASQGQGKVRGRASVPLLSVHSVYIKKKDLVNERP